MCVWEGGVGSGSRFMWARLSIDEGGSGLMRLRTQAKGLGAMEAYAAAAFDTLGCSMRLEETDRPDAGTRLLRAVESSSEKYRLTSQPQIFRREVARAPHMKRLQGGLFSE